MGQILKRIAQRSGVQGRFNPHAWRHFFGAEWVRRGGDISTLMDVMGHSSIEVTKVYLRYDTETLQEEHSKYSPVAGWGK
jgi:integrase/recombinase XerD